MNNQHSEAGHGNATSRSRLKTALAIVVVIMVTEVAGGILSNSLALLGDAGLGRNLRRQLFERVKSFSNTKIS